MNKTDQPAEPGTELLIIDPQELTESMPALLAEIDTSIERMQAAYKKLPKIVDEETKAIHFAFKDQVILKLTQDKERRMPFTRRLNEIIKLFTSREAERERHIKLTDDTTAKYTREQVEIARVAQAKIDAEARLVQAKIALEGRIRDLLRQRLNGLLDEVRAGAGSLVQKVTKANFETTKTRLNTEPKWSPKMTAVMVEKPAWVTDEEHFLDIVAEESGALKEEYLTGAKEICASSLTILETALTNKAEAESMQAAEDARQKAAQEEKAKQIEKDVAGQQAIAALDTETVEQPKARIQMIIEILDNEAWLFLISWWYKHDKEARDKDLTTKTFKQCKTFCEKWYNTTGEMIEHSSLQYVEEIKARR